MTASIMSAAGDDPVHIHETVKVAAFSLGFAVGEVTPNTVKLSAALCAVLIEELQAGFAASVAKSTSGSTYDNPPRTNGAYAE